MITAPTFWMTDSGWSRALAPVAGLYGLIAGARMRRPPRHVASVPVIGIGNFVAGGAGKTPTAIAVARIATRLGASPIIVLRGYGGRKRGPLLVDAEHDTALDVGDEALMVARAGIPAIIARDRAAGADFAIACGSDLIILDDGLQSPVLSKDLTLVVIDTVYGIGNGRSMPAGPLRAPLHVQLAATDALIVVSNGLAASAAEPIAQQVADMGRPVIRARLSPSIAFGSRARFDGRPVVAFAGIGRPEKLAESLRAQNIQVREMIGFPDHHRYTNTEAAALLRRAENAVLVTTAKDMARLSGALEGPLLALSRRAQVFDVEMMFEQEDVIEALLAAKIPATRRITGLAVANGSV